MSEIDQSRVPESTLPLEIEEIAEDLPESQSTIIKMTYRRGFRSGYSQGYSDGIHFEKTRKKGLFEV